MHMHTAQWNFKQDFVYEDMFLSHSLTQGSQTQAEVERVQKYSTQVKVPLHYWNFT